MADDESWSEDSEHQSEDSVDAGPHEADRAAGVGPPPMETIVARADAGQPGQPLRPIEVHMHTHQHFVDNRLQLSREFALLCMATWPAPGPPAAVVAAASSSPDPPPSGAWSDRLRGPGGWSLTTDSDTVIHVDHADAAALGSGTNTATRAEPDSHMSTGDDDEDEAQDADYDSDVEMACSADGENENDENEKQNDDEALHEPDHGDEGPDGPDGSEL